MGDVMTQYAITYNPSDYPGKYVVRRWTITPGQMEPAPEPDAVVDTLEQAREAVPRGMFGVPRWDEDDPVIVEVWI